MGKTIFRKIGGRIVPIKLSSKQIETGAHFYKERLIQAAHAKTGELLGKAYVQHGTKKSTARITDITIREKFRGKGIGKALFKHIENLYSRAGFKFLRTQSAITNPIQAAIRASSNSRFLLRGVGQFGEQSKMIGGSEAVKYLKLKELGKLPSKLNHSHLEVTTKLLKKLRGIK